MSETAPPGPLRPAPVHGRLPRPMVLGIFGGVLAVVLIGSAVLVKSLSPTPQVPKCTGDICKQPPVAAPPLVTQTPYASTLGFTLEYDGDVWHQIHKDDHLLRVQAPDGLVLTVSAVKGTDAAALLKDRMSQLGDEGIFDLTPVDNPRIGIISPAVGGVDAVDGSGLYEGHEKTGQGVSISVDVVLMVATDGKVCVAVSAVVDSRKVPIDIPPKGQFAWDVVDTVMESFRGASQRAA